MTSPSGKRSNSPKHMPCHNARGYPNLLLKFSCSLPKLYQITLQAAVSTGFIKNKDQAAREGLKFRKSHDMLSYDLRVHLEV